MNGRSEHAAVERGRAAWGRLKQGMQWDDWMQCGEALLVGRSECFAVTHTTDTNSKLYRNAFSDWLKQNQFADMEKGIRSRLLECMAHRAEIENWRATLSMNERLEFNHPQAVLRKWKHSTAEGAAAAVAAGESKPGLRGEVAKLQEELDKAHKKLHELEKENKGPLIDRNDSPQDIARVIMEWLPDKKRHPVAGAMMNLLKTTARPIRVRRRQPEKPLGLDVHPE